MPKKKYVREHFTYDELACRCGCGKMELTDDFLDALEEYRVALGSKMVVTSGYRCPAHNSRVSTTGKTGPHTSGAVDWRCSGRLAHKAILLAIQMGWTGIGVNMKAFALIDGKPIRRGKFLHMDRLEDKPGERPRPVVWSY